MISVWNPRRVSSCGPAGRWLKAGILLGAALAGGPAAAQVRAEGPAPVPALRVAAGRTAEAGLQRWLDEDRAWLAGLPRAVRAVLDLGAGDWQTVAAADSLAGAQSAVGVSVWPLGPSFLGAGSPPQGGVGRRSVVSMLRDRWVGRGYLTAGVRVAAAAAAAVPDTLVVDPGPTWTYGSFTVEGEDFPGRDRLLEVRLPRPGQPVVAETAASAVAAILTWAGEAGYPFARWVTRSVRLDPRTQEVDVTAALLVGTAARIGPVTSDLPPGPGADFLVTASGLRRGQRFSEEDLQRARQRLVARDLYAKVEPPRVYLTGAADTVGVHFPVIPRRKANRVQVILGLSRRGDQQGSRLSGQVDLSLPNMAGTGRSLQAGWRDDGDRISRFGLDYLEPLALGTPLDLLLALDQQIQRESFTRFRFDMTGRLPVVALWGIEMSAGWDRATYPTGSLQTTRRVRLGVGLSHRRGDRTRSGWEGLFALESGWRTAGTRPVADDSTAVGRLAADEVQSILRMDLQAEHWLGPVLSLAGRASYRRQTGGDPEVPLAEQFRFGGATTVRGYNQEEFHGSRAGWGGVELRVGRPESSRLYTFYDLGYFEFWSPQAVGDAPQSLALRTGRPRGYGLGLLARTRGGDLSLAIGFPGTVDFDQAKLHVTLLETF